MNSAATGQRRKSRHSGMSAKQLADMMLAKQEILDEMEERYQSQVAQGQFLSSAGQGGAV